jgi:hypothetical protein
MQLHQLSIAKEILGIAMEMDERTTQIETNQGQIWEISAAAKVRCRHAYIF